MKEGKKCAICKQVDDNLKIYWIDDEKYQLCEFCAKIDVLESYFEGNYIDWEDKDLILASKALKYFLKRKKFARGNSEYFNGFKNKRKEIFKKWEKR